MTAFDPTSKPAHRASNGRPGLRLQRWIPALAWIPRLRRHWRRDLPSDIIAGSIVAILLVPQGIAYAMLAGLPPQVGLYAGVVPVAIYALLGTSNSLAVGPTAVVSLLVASGIGPLVETGGSDAVSYALTLALMVGIIQGLMGWVRLGALVNFLSHAVLAGFTSAAALVIAASQFGHLLGVSVERSETFVGLARSLVSQLPATVPIVLAIGLGSLALLYAFRLGAERLLDRLGVPPAWSSPLAKVGPFAAVAITTLVTWALDLNETANVAIIGSIPRGLPAPTLPVLDLNAIVPLLPTALAISVIGYVESFAVAKVLGARRRESVRSNQELLALGAANVGASLSGGYPVTGGFSRSMVNFTAGARTPFAGLVTAGLLAITLVWFTPLFTYLPKATLAAVILVAVSGLIDLRVLLRFWRYSRADAAAYLLTFVGVLVVGIERGIVVGAGVALAIHLWRTTQPHVAIVGRVGASEHYRNVLRHTVQTWPNLLLMRIDESLYFANAQTLETRVLDEIGRRHELEHCVLIASAVNFIDGSALETLETLRRELASAGVTLHLAEVKGPVMDRLERVDFREGMGDGRIFLSTQAAVDALVDPLAIEPNDPQPDQTTTPRTIESPAQDEHQ